ncbi:MAG: hypothetical protein DHS20C17_17780 [Cyclobacteriaceae bacterium]|nr:MAG: hypothetical protein DHS20C17_17780 [Cyclobacteriaceae bacterium]
MNTIILVKHIFWSLLLILNVLVSYETNAQLPDEFQRVELVSNLTNSISIEFAPDGRIFIIDRYGEILIYKPSTQSTVSAGVLNVSHTFEDGLLDLAFDPNFTSNNYVYIHYSVAGVWKNRVSRFTMNGDVLDTGSEVIVIDWDTQRNGCCHAAGDLDFDSQGNLYIAIGDNTAHSLYATLNETDSDKSSEKSSSNTNDLRGKILRIRPQSNGSYTIPGGNLFPGGIGGLPEIYVMGARNPFKIFVDKQSTDWLFWGEVGPDANSPGPAGPVGMDEINLTKSAGNYGWPYFSGKNEPYLNNYATPQFYYDPQAPVNISTWNTGATNLPPAKPSWLEFFHESYLAGPRYYFDPTQTSKQKLPIEFNGAFFYYDFNTSQVWAVKMDTDGTVISNDQMAPAVFPSSEDGFIDMQIGPDGHMYILEYGAGCCPGNVGTGKLVRVDYTGVVSNSSPVISMSANPNNGSLPLMVDFSSEGTFDPDGDPLTYAWDFDTDGTIDSNLENPSFTYTSSGTFNAQLRVSDNQGGLSVQNITIYAGNNATAYEFNSPVDGGFITWNQDVMFDVAVSDVEDGNINCADVNMVPSLGHLNHFHDDLTIDACPKTMKMDPLDHNIHGEMDVFYVLGVNFTDQGGLTSFDQIRLYPKRTEAEFYDEKQAVEVLPNNDPWGGGASTIRVDHDSYIAFTGRNLININAIKYRTASTSAGGMIEFRLDSIDGQLINVAEVPATGSTSRWVDYEVEFEAPEGMHDLYFVFKQSPGATDILDLNWIEFMGSGVSQNEASVMAESVEALTSTIVSVVYDQPIDEQSAERLENYSIDNGIEVTGAHLQPDQRTVYLIVSPLTVSVNYNIDIAGAFQFQFSYESCSQDFPVQWEEHLIDNALPYRSVYILPQQDIDGDGLKDIVTGGWWYKNPGTAGGNWVKNTIGNPFNNVTWIYDFDGDGDQDLFGTQGQYESLDLVWAENNGSGNFTIHSNLPSGTSTHDEIFIAGIAGGVFQSGGPYQMAITWNGAEDGSSEVQMVTVPADPVNGTWTIESIHPTSIGEGLSAGDIDDDGDLDLFQAGNWLRNDAGTWTLFSTGITFNTLFDRNSLSDFDQDGDLDGVAGQIGTNEEVAWLEAPDDPTQLWTKHVIDPLIDGTLSLGVADMDFDGDEDIIIGEFLGEHKLFGFENDLNNSGSWIKHILDNGSSLDHHDGSQLVDIDDDGDLDIMTLGWFQIVPRIFENKSQAANCSQLIVVNPGNQFYDENDEVELQIIAGDADPGGTLTYAASGLPPTLSIDAGTGLITGTVTISSGSYSVTITVGNGTVTSEETFLIQVGLVTGIPDPPNIGQLKVYPNPANNPDAILEVDLNSAEELDIHVYDMIGKLYNFGSAQFAAGKNQRMLNFSQLNNGVYYLRLVSRSSNTEGIKIVISK